MKWGSSLNFVHAHGNFATLELQKLFNRNNHPLVQIHCIIKIMCQDLPLGWLDGLFGLCSAKTETLVVVRDFSFFTGTSNASEISTQYCYPIFLFCTNFSEFGELHKYGECSDCYRLFCFWQILFLMHCFACFDETIDCIDGISHGEIIIQ